MKLQTLHPPRREDAAPAAEQAGEVARPSQRIRFLLLAGAAFLIAMAALQWADVVEWLDHKMQFRGTYSQCLIEEKRKLFDYPLLPENMTRPDSLKLVLPPGNLQLR